MVDIIFSVLTGAVAFLTVALPLYWKWKKHNADEDKKADTAADDPRLGEFVNWVRNHEKKD